MSDELDAGLTGLGYPDRSSETPVLPDAGITQQVLHHVPVRVAIFGRDLRFRFANRELMAFHGLEPDHIVGRHVADVLGPEIAANHKRITEHMWSHGESVRWEGWLDFVSVGRRYVRTQYLPCFDAEGKVEAVSAFAHDLTELKLREQEVAARAAQLAASEALKSAIVDHALAALVSTDEHGAIVEFNPAAEAMFGHARAAVIGRPVGEVVVPPSHRAQHESGMRRLAAGGAPRMIGRRIEMPALRADGSEFPVEMLLWRTDVAGEVFHTASIVDVTERHAAQAQIERQREALRQSERSSTMGSLLAGVAHELNNPLSIVMGRAELLEEGCRDQPALAANARRVRDAAERCARIVRTFLDLARSRAPQRSAVRLNDVVRSATDMLSYSLRSHGIAIDVQTDEALPPTRADADQLGQIVLNLLVNAQQALAQDSATHAPSAPPTTGPRRLMVQTGSDAVATGIDGHAAAQVWVRVADSGPGVAPDVAARIFEPFFTTKAEGQGTGIGLAMSRALAREHGGDLVLEPESMLGGASFKLSLPLADASPPPTPSLGPSVTAKPAAVLRVLVVDDEPELASLMQEVLESEGYDVATAESGATAIAMLEAAPFDAVVSDMHMPDVDGAALWRHLSQAHPALARRMLFVTGNTLSPANSAFLRHARCAGLNKPFANDELVRSVGALFAANDSSPG